MPTLKFKSIDDVYTALTDFEIEDDRDPNGVPVAEISVPGLHRIKIGMVSEWDYFKYLVPMRNSMFTYYAQTMIERASEEEIEMAKQRVNTLLSELSDIVPNDIKGKGERIAYLFEDEIVRKMFFNAIKKMGIIRKWVSFKRWQKKICRHHSLTLFILLWHFNFNGVKKKLQMLLKTVVSISQGMNSQSPIESINYTNFESFQKMYLAAKSRQSSGNSEN